jgi:predicted nucleotidyltransferase
MNVFDTYTHQLLNQLNLQQVQYLVVGGYAVNYHGYRRTTGDIDLWIKPENKVNKEAILKSFRNLNVDKDSLTRLAALDFTKPIVFIDGEEPFKIDFMTHISGVSFEEAWQKKLIAKLEGLEVPFIHLNHLILSKIASGRPQDKIDVDKLQQIQQLKSDQTKT